MKKSKVFSLAVLIALIAFCTPPKGVAQGAKGSGEQTRFIDPYEIDSNKLEHFNIFEALIWGVQTTDINKSSYLQYVGAEIIYSKPTKNKISKIEIAYEVFFYDTTTWFFDVSNLNYAGSYVTRRIGHKQTPLKIYADLNTEDFNLGDTILTINAHIGIGLDGITPTYTFLEPQYVVYGQKPSSTGIHDLNSTQKIYPNPFSDQINLFNFDEVQPIKITDALGQTIYVGLSSSSTIETSNFVSGVYFLYTENKVYKLVKH